MAHRALDAVATSPTDDEIGLQAGLRPRPDRRRTRFVLATALGVALGAIPVLVAFAVALAAAQAVSPPSGAGVVAWWLLVFAASAGATFGTQELVRRYFPLVGLLRLALAFPADVPSRLGLALRAGTIRDLERGVINLRDGKMDDPALAAAHVVAFAAALQRHDRFTRGHSERVRAYTDLLATEYGLTKEARGKLRWAALLHDIGKLEVPTTLLNKPGALDHDEWLVMREHAGAGLRLSQPLRDALGEWVDGIGHHHERYDGSGYPLGLEGQTISLGGRIVAVADSYETMTAARPYKTPISHADARQELVASSGRHFDPTVVHAMLRLSVRRLRWAAGPLAALGDLLASRLIAAGGPRGAGHALGATPVLRVVATTAAAVTAVSLGWMAAEPTAPPATYERVGVVTTNGDGADVEATVADVSTPGATSSSPIEVSSTQSAPGGTVAGVDQSGSIAVSRGAEPQLETVIATPAIPPQTAGDGPATPAIPALPAPKPEVGR